MSKSYVLHSTRQRKRKSWFLKKLRWGLVSDKYVSCIDFEMSSTENDILPTFTLDDWRSYYRVIDTKNCSRKNDLETKESISTSSHHATRMNFHEHHLNLLPLTFHVCNNLHKQLLRTLRTNKQTPKEIRLVIMTKISNLSTINFYLYMTYILRHIVCGIFINLVHGTNSI